MKTKVSVPINTLDKALGLAHTLMRDVALGDKKTQQTYRIFSALATSEGEGLAAFLIWRAQGEIIREFAYKE